MYICIYMYTVHVNEYRYVYMYMHTMCTCYRPVVTITRIHTYPTGSDNKTSLTKQ